ncbi:ABC transporter substrate-binding protein [Palleronia sp. KMU-117]|uniref:ABC transporter substrate-binding protein n=1 Tax=Palleronia sp. KMU-117 TaxID=3434108 RepID=UPI003D73DB9E
MTVLRHGLMTAVAVGALTLALPVASFAQDVKNPGVLVHAADDEATTLDPAQVEPGEGGETIILQVYERLLDIGPGSPDLIPALATEVPTDDNGLISADGLTYTFPLRQGVVFHDGTPFTAHDVKFSWDRAMTMDLPEGNAGVLQDMIASTEVVDDYTFRVTLNRPSASFLNSVVIAMVASVVSQDAVEANGGVEAGAPNIFMAGNMVGTGPYKFVVWNRSENLQLEVNDDYWGEKANLDVRIEIGGDPDVRVLGLRAGEYDTIETDPSFVADLEGAEGVTIYNEGLLLEPLHIGFNLNIPEGALPAGDTIPTDFFHDPRVRQAFNYAFDYEAFLNGPLAGYGDFNTHYIPVGIFGYDPEAPRYNKADPEKAAELFKEAGYWDDGFTVSVITEEGNLFALMSLVLKDSLAKINPKFNVNVMAVAETVFDDAHAQDPLEYAMWAKNADPAADPDAYMRAYVHPDGEWGQVHGFANGYRDPAKVAELIEAASVELDTDTRAAIYSELQTMLYDDPMWLIGAQEGVVMAHRDWVQGFQMQPLWPRPGLKFALLNK